MDKICSDCPYKDKCEYTTLPPDLRGESCQYYSLALKSEVERMTSDEKQVQQLKEEIARVEAKLENLRSKKVSTEDQDKIAGYDCLLYDLKGQLGYWKRRLANDQRTA